ncbi:MAG: DsbA oxidoreductase [Proteobacteria bacterium]|jgi:2-hydroxychromene-2-carboxylate isomerase|nr:DsbA oxidoreductase [Pseudomonadota bacterium]
MRRPIEFFYFIGSTYSYLSVTRAEALAARQGIELTWRPFSVRTLMREQNNVPFATQPVKMSYMWRDLERRAAKFGVPFDGIPPYPIDPFESANHVATLAAREGWCKEFTQAAYRTWFMEKQDPGAPQALRGIVTALGRDADDTLARASAAQTQDEYRAATERARQLGLFGSPTFVAGQDIFWGDDRLEDALAWCAAQRAREGP